MQQESLYFRFSPLSATFYHGTPLLARCFKLFPFSRRDCKGITYHILCANHLQFLHAVFLCQLWLGLSDRPFSYYKTSVLLPFKFCLIRLLLLFLNQLYFNFPSRSFDLSCELLCRLHSVFCNFGVRGVTCSDY